MTSSQSVEVFNPEQPKIADVDVETDNDDSSAEEGSI
jgi:hypothetical protein